MAVPTATLMMGPAAEEPTVEYRTFATFNADLEALKQWLLEAGCTHALMESTGSCWKPVFHVLEDSLQVCTTKSLFLCAARRFLHQAACCI